MKQLYADGKTSMDVHERKASIRQFYGEISEKWWDSKLIWSYKSYEFM